MKVEKIIGGGQTGADQAGWRAAKSLSIATGGLMPLGYRTEGALLPDGRIGPDEEHPEFADRFGATQHHSRDYPPRTRENVRAADCTLIFNLDRGRGFSSGTAQAVKAARQLGKEFVVANVVRDPASGFLPPSPIAAFEVTSLERLHAGEVRRWPNATRDDAAGRLVDFLGRHDFRVLNVAGSRESNAPGVGRWVEVFLLNLLAR